MIEPALMVKSPILEITDTDTLNGSESYIASTTNAPSLSVVLSSIIKVPLFLINSTDFELSNKP